MSVPRDQNGWARPRTVSEWRELLEGTGIEPPLTAEPDPVPWPTADTTGTLTTKER